MSVCPVCMSPPDLRNGSNWFLKKLFHPFDGLPYKFSHYFVIFSLKWEYYVVFKWSHITYNIPLDIWYNRTRDCHANLTVCSTFLGFSNDFLNKKNAMRKVCYADVSASLYINQSSHFCMAFPFDPHFFQ